MNEQSKRLGQQAGFYFDSTDGNFYTPAESQWINDEVTRLVELTVKECIKIIESQQVSMGNSAAGEMAAEWTMDALRDCRTEIREHFFGVV